MPNITLCCFIQGDNPDNIFEVEVEKNNFVSNLKGEIKKKKPYAFLNFNIDKLWKVNISLDEIDKLNIYASTIKELKGEVLDTTKKVVKYFSDEFSDNQIHIIVQRERINVAFFGLAGHGKSSTANMLIQGDIYRENNEFGVNDGAEGGTIEIHASNNDIFQVYDTIGLGEPSDTGSVSHKKAVKEIKNYFSKCEVSLNYIFYVKKKDRFTNIDVEKFKTFKSIFKGREKNFIIIITHSNPKWVKENLETVKQNFGDYPIIPVDFPWSEDEDDDDDDNDAQYNQKKRAQSLQMLLDELLMLKSKRITLCCFIQGDHPDNIFKIEIENGEPVSNLKEEIKKKKPYAFLNFNIDKLWKVNISLDEIDKLNIYASTIKELKGEELDTTKKVVKYFSDEFSDKQIHIIVQRERINVALFGLTGHGKSSIANMLIQGDIYRKNNEFGVIDGAKVGTTNINCSTGEIFQVYDTIGLGAPYDIGSVSHDKAVKEIKNYFSMRDVPLNYIFYVKKKGRFTEIDADKFKAFKSVFKGREKIFIIIITHCKWVKENLEIIKKNFGDYPIIPVDFPWNDDDDDDDAQYNQKKRAQSLQILLDELLMLKGKRITLRYFIQGDCPDNIFKIEIENSEPISNLKEEIKKKNPDAFDILEIGKLYKVDIPLDENDNLNIADNEEFESEELDTTKLVVEYFSDELPEKHIHIIIRREQINIALFGLTGHGKSSISNMLIQGNIYRENNKFKVNDSAVGETTNINGSTNEIFQVFDTIGLGEPSTGSVSHKKAVKEIRDYFSICEIPLNYIFYVKKKGRFTEEDVEMFKTFKSIFEGGEKNFIIVITNSNPGWVERNLEIIKKNFGDFPIIPVDFPWSENEDDDDDEAQYHLRKRTKSLQYLLDELSNLKYKSIKLEVLSSSQKTEDTIAKIVDFIPFVGSTYQLISAGIYYKLGKSKMVKQRLMSGGTGLVLDVTTIATMGTMIGVRGAVNVGKVFGKAVAVNVGPRVVGKVVEIINKFRSE